jgi:hypothetical protein
MPAKPLTEIKIKETRTSTARETTGQVTDSVVYLSDKIDDYIFKLGYSSAHTLGVITQLLYAGKIRLEFRDYNERLQLLNAGDAMERADAMSLTEAYLASMRREGDTHTDLDMTQKVIIQTPRRPTL